MCKARTERIELKQVSLALDYAYIYMYAAGIKLI